MWKRIRTISAIAIVLCLVLGLNVLPVNADSNQSNVSSLPAQRSGPPVGFNPETASDAELKVYGFPARPSDPTALQKWDNAMQHAKTYVKPVLAQATTGVRSDYSGYSDQAGYAVLTSQNPGLSTFDEVSGSWTQNEPPPPASGFIGYYLGLGGIDNQNLVQAGCASDIPQNTVNHFGLQSNSAFFAEYYTSNVWPIQTCIWVANVVVNPGDVVYVDVENFGGTSSAFVLDEYNTQYTWVNFYTPNCSCDSADYMFEPQEAYFPLIPSTLFTGCWCSNISGASGFFNNYTDDEEVINGSPHVTPIQVSNGSFLLNFTQY
jgi:Peptidase A4 family